MHIYTKGSFKVFNKGGTREFKKPITLRASLTKDPSKRWQYKKKWSH